MRVTIADVAKHAGVSKSTVSRILNGNYGQNTQETIDKVLRIIKELDYRPNMLAQSLKSMKTNVIGIILSNLKNPFWARVLEGVEDTCRLNGYSLMICNSNEDPLLEDEHIKGFQMKQVDGIIINPTVKNDFLYKSIVEKQFPFVTINRKIFGLDVDLVTMDNVAGAFAGVEHLLRNGKKSIALFVYTPDNISPRLDRIEGYKKALTKNGVMVEDSLIHIIEEKKGMVKETVKRILSENYNRPEAIFSTNNMMTLEILEGIKELGLNVPDDISLLGYDETVWSMHLDPPLTTVNQPSYEMGELAAKRLIELIEKKGDKEPTINVLQPNLIIRESCGTKKEHSC
ncbi:LacI family DNA-binding transcriptional regulator [Robertmurraya sp. FSL R5-0851]|uniref:LacI family DNA-binding transcriptional regulator n=1 Tax=Robertmurraya sp. FSL R5-0851 TaxID=2921584 RepID=UPI0030F9F78F